MELCTLLKNFPKKTTVFLYIRKWSLKNFFILQKTELSYIFSKESFPIFQKTETLKNLYISGKGTLLYFRKWNFTAQRLTNFRRKLPSSKNYFIFWQMKLYWSKNKKVLIFHSKLSKPTLFALTWKKKKEKDKKQTNPPKLMFWVWIYYFTLAKDNYKTGIVF